MLFFSQNNIRDMAEQFYILSIIKEEEINEHIDILTSNIRLYYSEAVENELQYDDEAFYVDSGIIYHYLLSKEGYVICTLFCCLTKVEDLDYNFCKKTCNYEFYNLDKKVN